MRPGTLALPALVVAGALLILSAQFARAHPMVFFDRAELAAALTERHGEQPVGGGLQSEAGVVEVWTSAEGATWTILLTRPDGISCVMATGTDWFSRPFEPPPAGADG